MHPSSVAVPSFPALLWILGALAVPGVAPSTQEVDRCAPAERFLAAELGMDTVVEPDTLDDWRSGRALPACRITAAGTTGRKLSDAAADLFRRLRRAGWRRTPNPADAPGESSLRFRLGETDCLFNVYSGVLLGTRAELEVSGAAVPEAGERRLNVLVLCSAALDPDAEEGGPARLPPLTIGG